MKKINLLGQRFGRLTVIGEAERKKEHHDARWLCRCECGNEKIVRSGCLKSGNTKSCGCLHREETSRRSVVDISNQRFGSLVALKRVEHPNNKSRNVWWECQCDCGNLHIAEGTLLRHGRVSSCGCSKRLNVGDAAFNKLYYNYKNSWRRSDNDNKRRNIARLVFDIPRNKFKELVESNCFYCGNTPSSVIKADNGNYIYNGLDRVDNDSGYTIENVVTCCGECNFYKGAKSQHDFIAWIERVSKHLT